MPAELTVAGAEIYHRYDNETEWTEVGDATYGWVCPEHPEYAPTGLNQRHATNSMNKHNREHHDPGTTDREELTALILHYLPELPAWDAGGPSAVGLADAIAAVGFHRAPF